MYHFTNGVRGESTSSRWHRQQEPGGNPRTLQLPTRLRFSLDPEKTSRGGLIQDAAALLVVSDSEQGQLASLALLVIRLHFHAAWFVFALAFPSGQGAGLSAVPGCAWCWMLTCCFSFRTPSTALGTSFYPQIAARGRTFLDAFLEKPFMVIIAFFRHIYAPLFTVL